MTFKERYGNTALIAGASEGMGAAFADPLAFRGLDLILVARRKEVLEATASRIVQQFGVKVKAIVCDLGDADATQQIINAVGDLSIDFLVCNAASSYIGPFLETDLSTHLNITEVNMRSPLALVHYFGGKMVERGKGGIVIMSSIAGFQGSGFLSTYAATKAFSRVLAEGLWYEWRPKGVDVIACCAGATATPNYINTNPGKASALEPKPQLPEQVANECLRTIGKKPSFISGGGNKLVSFLMQHIFTKKKAIEMISDGVKKMYRIKE
jgi:short-subunit dehydrogenase